jgi:Altronate dehydratase
MMQFQGYKRSRGPAGVRNYVAVIPVSVATASIADTVAARSDHAVRSTPHQMGGDPPEKTREQIERTLIGVGRNPNVGASLLLSLGTETTDYNKIIDGIAAFDRPVEHISVHEAGGTAATIETAVDVAQQLVGGIAGCQREACDVSDLRFGVECGGSDATSGIAANPAVGASCDLLVEAGGTACFSETPEFIGAEHILAERCPDPAVRERLLSFVDARESAAELMGVDMRGAQPTPGNQEGGLTTIEEKSLGAIAKGGTTPVQDVVSYADELPTGAGLVIMDTPGYDVESVVGKVAGGAQVVAFTTGRGSTTGNPIVPVMKVTGNPTTARNMSSNMDVDVSDILDGESVASAGNRVYETLIRVASGQQTAAEQRRLEEFAINELMPNELAGEPA